MAESQIVQKLRTLGVFPNSVETNAEIFERYTDIESIAHECGRNHWGVRGSQFVYFHLESLLKNDNYRSQFLSQAKEQLSRWGISPEHIEEFYSSGTDPGLIFTLKHEDIYPANIRVPFYNKASQFALDKIREWLGIEHQD